MSSWVNGDKCIETKLIGVGEGQEYVLVKKEEVGLISSRDLWDINMKMILDM